MRNIVSLIFILVIGLILNACVDDYQDANPPLLLDAPAVSSVTAADDLIFDGQEYTDHYCSSGLPSWD